MRPFVTFGRVPFLYYVLHVPLLHVMGAWVALVRYGKADWLLANPPGPELAARLPLGPDHHLCGVGSRYLDALSGLPPVCRYQIAPQRLVAVLSLTSMLIYARRIKSMTLKEAKSPFDFCEAAGKLKVG